MTLALKRSDISPAGLTWLGLTWPDRKRLSAAVPTHPVTIPVEPNVRLIRVQPQRRAKIRHPLK
ncbi:hypothetical protein GCM10028818_35560 [Spirosoma horti]